jgi:uncharacterized protein (TIGR00255 family)
MSLKSMTGHGRASVNKSGLFVVVELSSVNRKQLDVRLNMPRAMAMREAELSSLIKGSLDRGNVTGSVQVQFAESSSVSRVDIDMDLAQSTVTMLRSAAKRLKLDGDLRLDTVLSLPGVVVERSVMDDVDQVMPLCVKAVKQAVKELIKMRAVEGEALEHDLVGRLDCLEALAKKLSTRAPSVKTHHIKALKGRLEEAGALDADMGDLIGREMVVFAERADVTEELIRLASHFSQTRKMLNGKKPVGRTLDFLCQELFREINTIGSKANDATLAQTVVNAKTELEKTREQVQNIE